jgi:hypothetical protein
LVRVVRLTLHCSKRWIHRPPHQLSSILLLEAYLQSSVTLTNPDR